MADEKRTLFKDLKENFFDVGLKGNIVEGDVSRYKIPERLPEEAIKVRPKKSKIQIENENEFEAAFNAAMEKAYDRKKLPTKYTSEGARELATVLNPLNPLQTTQTIKKWKEDQKPEKLKKRKYIEGYTDIAKSILRGGPNFIQSASEFILSPIDYIFSSDFQSKFNKQMDKVKEPLGEAETFPGGIAELISEYAIPISVATKITSGAKTYKKIKNLQQSMGTSKASKIAQRMTRDASILGIAEVMTGSGSQPNMDYGFTTTPESTEGLTGKELAAATFRNKLKYAKEGTLIGGGFPLVGKGLQLGYKFTAKPILKGGVNLAGGALEKVAKLGSTSTYVVPKLANLLRQAPIVTGEKIIAPAIIALYAKTNPIKVAQQLPPFKEWRMLSKTNPNKVLSTTKSFDDFLSFFRSWSEDTLEMGFIKETLKNTIKSKSRRMNKALEDIDNSYYKLAKDFQAKYNKNTASPVGQKYFNDQIMEYLKGQRKLITLPKELQFSAKDINKSFDEMREALASSLPKNKQWSDFKADLLNRGNKYMRASFEIFERPLYQPLPAIKNKAVDYVLKKVVKNNRDFREAAFENYSKMPKEVALKRQALDIVENILYTGRAEKIDPIAALRKIGVKFLRDDKYQLIRKGEELPDVIQSLLGKQSNLKSSVLTTTAEIMGEVYAQRGYNELARLLQRSGQLVKTEAEAAKWPGHEQIIKVGGLGRLGSEIQGLYGSKELIAAIRNQGGVLDKLIKSSIWRHLLQFKAGTQMGKTVFSPQTQVRNVYSAGFFPFARGHLGGRASVIDSFRIVLEDIFPTGKLSKQSMFDFIEKEIRLGTMDENIIASELGAVLNDIKKGAINSLDELLQKLSDTSFVKNATRLYAGGDNLWKIYGRQYVKSQMTEVLPTIPKALEYANHMGLKIGPNNPLTLAKRSLDDILDEISAHEIKNTYPTYSKVPPAIKNIRKIPFIGNFIAFPAEIVRTATRIMDFNLKQMAHSNPRIRQMGIKGSISTSLAFGGVGVGLTALSQALTGTSEGQWEAYQRSFGADWDRNANLIAFTGFDKGKAKAFNFSYFSPYDFLQKPLSAVMQKAQEQNLNEADTSEFIMEMMLAKDGPLMEMLAPFLSEQLGLEALLDVQPGGILLGGRGGRTAEGSRIYSESDDIGDKIQKSFMHLLNAVEPGAVSIGQKFIAGASGDLSKSGQPINLKDELIALFSGVRIINIDVLKSMEFKTGAFNRLMRAVDDTESIYSPKGYQSRGPEVVLKEFNQMQMEAYKGQQKFHQLIQDARTIGLSDYAIRDKLKEQNVGRRMANNLMDGLFTPVNYSKARFEKKVVAVERLARQQSKDSKDFKYRVNEDYLYPKLQLDMLKLSYEYKKLDPKGVTYREEKNPNTSGIFGGPTIIQRGKNLIEKALPGRQFKSEVPPLPDTPMPKVEQGMSSMPLKDGLTRTETALLSPTEQVIAQNSRGGLGSFRT
tara:strand:+ start:575 stop:4960 length:4386 start_codon:yes stop_codon:yes gene_type:complete